MHTPLRDGREYVPGILATDPVVARYPDLATEPTEALQPPEETFGPAAPRCGQTRTNQPDRRLEIGNLFPACSYG